MIDLTKFYRDHSSGYFDKFKTRLVNVEYKLSDAQEIIDAFKNISKPPESDFEQNDSYFILLCFWLYKNGYSIVEFPNILSRPVSLYNFAYVDIRKYIMKRDGLSGTVQWSSRRELCDDLTIVSNDKFQYIPDEIEETIKLISTRGASFDGMQCDEKLALLNNLIENLLKRDGKFIKLNYKEIFFGNISEDQVKEYRHKTHCFRHGDSRAIEDRNKYSENEKNFLADLGIFIAIHFYRHLNTCPLLVNTHQYKDRVERDKEVERIFEHANIPLVRFTDYESLSRDDIIARFSEVHNGTLSLIGRDGILVAIIE